MVAGILSLVARVARLEMVRLPRNHRTRLPFRTALLD